MIASTDIVNRVFRKKTALIHQPAMVHLCDMAQLAPYGTAVEIGVYLGSSLTAIALIRADMGEVIGVDDWSYPDPPDLYGKTLANLEYHDVGNTTLYSMTSEQAAALIPGPLAFVHIDGNHTYPYIKQDIELWIPKIMPGGVATFHDYGRNRADIQVKQAVDEWQAKDRWKPLGEVLTTIGFQKP